MYEVFSQLVWETWGLSVQHVLPNTTASLWDGHWLLFFLCLLHFVFVVYYEGWTTVVWAQWVTSHVCTWHYMQRPLSKAARAGRVVRATQPDRRWCPDFTTRSAIVLPASGGTTVPPKRCMSLPFIPMLSISWWWCQRSITLDLNKLICYLAKIKVLFFVRSLWLALRTLVFN